MHSLSFRDCFGRFLLEVMRYVTEISLIQK
jgi:hypothetical protein